MTLIPWWMKLIAVAAIAAAIYFAWGHYVAEPYRKEGAAPYIVKEAERQELNSAVIVTLSNKLMEEKDAHAKAVSDLDKFFLVLETAGNSVARGRGVSIPDDVVGVLRSGINQANGQGTPAPSTGSSSATAAVPAAQSQVYDERDIALWGIATDKAYAKTVELLKSCYRQELIYWTALTGGTP
jgi:hypothetical protein